MSASNLTGADGAMSDDVGDAPKTAIDADPPTPTFSKLFAADAHSPRVRRTADGFVLVFATVVVLLAGWAARVGTDIERWVDSIVLHAPGWLTSIAGVVFAAGGVYTMVLTVVVASRAHRLRIARDMFAAGLLALLTALLAGRVFLGEWPDLLPEVQGDEAFGFPILRLAMITAVLAVARPAFTAPTRRINSRLLALTAVAAIVLQYGSLMGVIAAFGIGLAAAATLRLVFGTTDGVPSLERIQAALADLGVDARDLEYLPDPPPGRFAVSGTDAEGTIGVAVYGRDAANSALAARAWRAMWFRDGESVFGTSRQQQAEHEALMLMLATRAGCTVPRLVVAGTTETGDALVVIRPIDEAAESLYVVGALGSEAPFPTAPDLDDAVIESLWSEITTLHAGGLALGLVDPRRVAVSDADHGRRVELRNLSGGAASHSSRSHGADLAEVLVLTVAMVGEDRAIAAALRHCTTDDLITAMPMLQRSGLSEDVADIAKSTDLDLDDLRARLAGEIEIDAPELFQLRRVRVRDVVMLVLLLFAVNAMLGFFAEIDWDQFKDEISNASLGLILLGLVLAQLTNIAETLSLTGVVTVPIPWGPTLQFQYASSYIALAVPSDAGRIAMTIRYLQKLGVPTHIAVGQGPFTTVFGYLIDAVLLAITYSMVGSDIDLGGVDGSSASTLVTIAIIVVAAAVIAILAVLFIPALRRKVLPKVMEVVHELKGSLTDPNRAARLIGGLVAKKFLFALAFATVSAAFGYPISFATAIFINTCVSWFAGLIPVPGGIGVTEAAFTAGLVAFGVPQTAALAIAVTYRICTNYFPPVPGYFAMRRLERTGYL